MPSYTITDKQPRNDGTNIYTVILKTDSDYSEQQKYIATDETEKEILSEAAKSFQLSQPAPVETIDTTTPVEVKVSL